jgi:pilus assembly protein Flp/PilA
MRFKTACRRFVSDESGITAIQYSLIAILCSVAIIAGLYGVRGSLNQNLGDVSTNLQNANP